MTVPSGFRILIDTREQKPWKFAQIRADASDVARKKYKKGDCYTVDCERRSLGNSHGDYTVEGFESEIAIERKSLSDFQSTMLAWSNRREAFDRELAWLNSIECAVVIVEATMSKAMSAKQRGKRTVEQNAKLIHRRLLSCKIKYPRVSFLFCGSRKMAEVTAFRLLQMYWRKSNAGRKLKDRQDGNLETKASAGH